jgi:flagellar hook-length control protein FliK
MTKRRFAKRSCFAAMMAVALAAPCAQAQQAEPAPAKAGKPINAGDVLSGELSAMKVRGGKRGTKVSTYQVTSEPRRLPPPNGLCNLETGPETFQLITSSDAQAAQLKNFIGKEISVKVDEVACAQDAGQMSEAVITKWSVVTKH